LHSVEFWEDLGGLLDTLSQKVCLGRKVAIATK
jgi:hypothetical protein